MPIEFFGLVLDDGWNALSVTQSSPGYLWAEGGPLADAPVDMPATFKDSMWVSSKVDPSFNMNGLRCRPNFTVPRHHHNFDELIIVFAGEFSVEWGEDGKSNTIGAGEFWISDAGTPYMMTAGPEGVTYLETWPEPQSGLITTWHDGGWIKR